ncbi:MAG TPA: hypothetical protein VJQ85_01960 [Gaiellaceae bacterium]|nr:hypothetical protein [Gaiellaceae bacterium]
MNGRGLRRTSVMARPSASQTAPHDPALVSQTKTWSSGGHRCSTIQRSRW